MKTTLDSVLTVCWIVSYVTTCHWQDSECNDNYPAGKLLVSCRGWIMKKTFHNYYALALRKRLLIQMSRKEIHKNIFTQYIWVVHFGICDTYISLENVSKPWVWGHLWLRRPGGGGGFKGSAWQAAPDLHLWRSWESSSVEKKKKLKWTSGCFSASPLVWWPCPPSRASATMVLSRSGRLTSPGGTSFLAALAALYLP